MKRLDDKMKSESLGFTNYHEFSYASYGVSNTEQKQEKNSKDLGVSYWLYAPGENAEFWDEY
jgi:hypothetical protein